MTRQPGEGVIVHIHVAETDKAALCEQASLGLVRDRGIPGDRYFGRAPGKNVTLVEEEHLQEVCEAIGVPYRPGCSRRNVTVRGIDLKALVGARFRLGGATLHGGELCEPCTTLEESIGVGAMRRLVHKGGLRARVVLGGEIRVGDRLTVEPETP